MPSRKVESIRAERRFVRKVVRRSVWALVLCALLAAGFVLAEPYLWPMLASWHTQGGRFDDAREAISRVEDEETASALAKACDFASAEARLEAGEYDAARAAFLALGDYEGARDLARECVYRKATALAEAGDNEGAAALFGTILAHSDARDRRDACRYAVAEALTAKDDLPGAFRAFADLGEYADARARALELAVVITGIESPEEAYRAVDALSPGEIANMAALAEARERLRPGRLAVGSFHTVGLCADGRVLAAGDNRAGQCDVGEWRNAVQVDAGALHTAALLSDGTVVAAGSNECGQCGVGDWKNVVEIACGDYATYARLEDGTVVACGSPEADLSDWQGAVKLAAGAYTAAALDADGELMASRPSALGADFADPVDLDVSAGGAVILGRSGNAYVTFAEPLAWQGVVSVSMGRNCVLGIDSNGRVLARFFRASDENGIVSVADAVCVAAGGAHCAALDAQGRVYAFGNNAYGQCDVGGWTLQ